MDILDRSYYRYVYDLYVRCGVHSFPIDCEDIARKCGFKLIPYSKIKEKNHDEYIAILKYSSDAFQDRIKKIIYYNDTQNRKRIRFSLMHEISHYLLNHTSDGILDDTEADCLASMILAPRVMIHRLKADYKVTSDFLYESFDLSYASSNNTISDYNDWLIEISNQKLRKPNEYELLIQELFKETKSA